MRLSGAAGFLAGESAGVASGDGLVSAYREQLQERPAAFVVRIFGDAWGFWCGSDILGHKVVSPFCKTCMRALTWG